MKTQKKVVGIFIIINIGFNGVRGMNDALSSDSKSEQLSIQSDNGVDLKQSDTDFLGIQPKQYVQKKNITTKDNKDTTVTLLNPSENNDQYASSNLQKIDIFNLDSDNQQIHNQNPNNQKNTKEENYLNPLECKQMFNKKYIIGGALFIGGGLGYWAYNNKKKKLIIGNKEQSHQ